jgi:uncharacterized repeat protein (TIGR01451 family)
MMTTRIFSSHDLNRPAHRCLAGAIALAVIASLSLLVIKSSTATSSHQTANNQPQVVVSQIFGGGGTSPLSFRHDFIELFNRGAIAVDLSGWSVQYAAAQSNSWQKTGLSGSIAPGQYYLIQMAAGGGGSKDLPAPDARGPMPIDATGGKVALVKNNTLLSNTDNCPSPVFAASIVDFAGYGSLANCFEGTTPAPAAGNASATIRRGDGCTDTNSNNSDFTTGPPNPRNGLSALKPCGGIGVARADLVVTTQTSGASVAPRGLVGFIINVLNSGPSPATNVIVTDALADGFTEIRADSGGVVIGNNISWPAIPTLNPGGSRRFTVTAVAPAKAGKLVNRAAANSEVFDPDTANNVSNREVVVVAGALFENQNVRVTIDNTGVCSRAYTVQTRFTNTGATPQPDTSEPEFAATLSPEIVGIGGSCFSSKGRCRLDGGSRTVRWDGAVGVGEQVTVTYTVLVVAGQQQPAASVSFCIETDINFDSDNDGGNDSKTTVSACGTFACVTEQPTEPAIPPDSIVSDQKVGSILIFNLYSSNAANPAIEDTRINITNTNTTDAATVHLFFIEDDTGQVSDGYLCLSPNQTTAFLASDIDPGVTGYLIAVATDEATGCPVNFNFLLGDEYVRLSSGHAANLGAEALAALAKVPCKCDENSVIAELAFDGVNYNQAPRTLMASNLPSPGDGNSTLLVINRVGGDLTRQAETIGEFTGWLFDDLERGFSFSARGGCQFRQMLSNNFPRTAPRFTQILPSGHAGWMKLAGASDIGITGAVFVLNDNAKTNTYAFSGGRNLHKLRLTDSARIALPVFLPKC